MDRAAGAVAAKARQKWRAYNLRIKAKILARALGYCLLIFLIEILVPWNLLAESNQVAQDYLYRSAAPYFPHAGREPDLAPLVVMVTEQDQRALAQQGYDRSWTQWPPNAALFGEILEVLLDAGPEAVFLDVGFLSDRDSSDICRLAEVIESYAGPNRQAPAIPIFLAGDFSGYRGADEGGNYLCQGGEKIPYPEARETAIAIAAKRTGEVMPQLLEAGAQVVSVRREPPYYPLYDCAAQRPSAALGLYLHHLRSKRLVAQASPPNAPQGDGLEFFCARDDGAADDWRATAINAMSVYWSNRKWSTSTPQTGGNSAAAEGKRQDQAQPRFVQSYPCRDTPENLVTGLIFPTVENLRQLLDEPTFFGGLYSRQTCPPYSSLSAEVVLNSYGAYDALVRGKSILIGADFRMGNDLFQPPTHNNIPGVFQHAMALENLHNLPFLFDFSGSYCLVAPELPAWLEGLELRAWLNWANSGCGYLSQPAEWFGLDMSLGYRIISIFALSLLISIILHKIGGRCLAAIAQAERKSRRNGRVAGSNSGAAQQSLFLAVRFKWRVLGMLSASAVGFAAVWLIFLLAPIFVLSWEPGTLVDFILLGVFSLLLNFTPLLRALGRTVKYLTSVDDKLAS